MHSKLISQFSLTTSKQFSELLISCFNQNNIDIWRNISKVIDMPFLSEQALESKTEERFSNVMEHENNHAMFQVKKEEKKLNSILWNITRSYLTPKEIETINFYENLHKEFNKNNKSIVPSNEAIDDAVQEVIKEIMSK